MRVRAGLSVFGCLAAWGIVVVWLVLKLDAIAQKQGIIEDQLVRIEARLSADMHAAETAKLRETFCRALEEGRCR